MHPNNHVTVHFLEVLQRNGCDLQLSLRVEGLSINFSNVATRIDVSPQIYASPQSLTSVGLIYILVTRMLPNRNIRWPTKLKSV